MPDLNAPLRFIQISDTHINPDKAYNKHYAQFTPLVGVEAVTLLIKFPSIDPYLFRNGLHLHGLAICNVAFLTYILSENQIWTHKIS